MQLDAEKEYQRWIKQARQDLDDAEYNAQGERDNLACFLSQQAAEKSLKAFLYLHGEQIVWGHSAAELADNASQMDDAFLALREKGAFLDRFYIPTRYPNGLPGGIPFESFNKSDSTLAIEAAAEIINFVAKQAEKA